MPPTSQADFAPPSKTLCSQSKCKATLPVGYQFKTCENCRNNSRLGMRKKQKRGKADEGPLHSPATPPSNSTLKEKGPTEDSDTELTHDESKVSGNIFGSLRGHLPVDLTKAIQFKDKSSVMKQLTSIFETTERIFFHGFYDLPADPLISDRDRVKATAYEIWKVSGYRFR